MKPFLALPFLLLLLALLACAVPQAPGAAPTELTPTPLSVVTATPAVRPAAGEAAAPTPRPSATPPPRQHRIGIRRVYGLGEFYDRLSGETFTPRGVFYENIIPGPGGYQDRLFGVGVYDPAQVQADFARLRAAGYNTVRLRLDDCTRGAECLLQDGALNPAYLDNVADLMRQAQQQGLVLLLASSGLPEPDGYAGISLPGEGLPFAAGRNALILSAEGVEASRRYWGDLLAGLAEREAPFESVLGWELLDEFWVSADLPPFTLTDTLTTTLGQAYDMNDPAQRQLYLADATRHYIEQLRQEVLAYDPGALVGMGFLRPDFPNPARFNDYRYTDTASLLENVPLDFFDLNISPGGDLDLAQAVQNFGLNAQNTRPVLFGRVGAALGAYPNAQAAASAVQAWVSAACAYGVDGWLYASYLRSPQGLDEGVWGLGDANAYLLEAFSPALQPDRCTVAALPPANLAFGRPVTASAELPGAPASLAVDGSPAAWNPGAPPPQWLEIDLGAPSTVARLRLVAAPPAPPEMPLTPAAPSQSAASLHQVWAAGPDGKLRLVYEFNSPAEEGIFEVTFEAPLEGVQYLRIFTEQDSFAGWQEVEIYSP